MHNAKKMRPRSYLETMQMRISIRTDYPHRRQVNAVVAVCWYVRISVFFFYFFQLFIFKLGKNFDDYCSLLLFRCMKLFVEAQWLLFSPSFDSHTVQIVDRDFGTSITKVPSEKNQSVKMTLCSSGGSTTNNHYTITRINKNEKEKKTISTYRYHCQHNRYNSFPMRLNNPDRPSPRCRHICIRHPQGYIGHVVNIHFRIQLREYQVEEEIE